VLVIAEVVGDLALEGRLLESLRQLLGANRSAGRPKTSTPVSDGLDGLGLGHVVTVPRDREGSFEPKIVKKRQKRLSGVCPAR